MDAKGEAALNKSGGGADVFAAAGLAASVVAVVMMLIIPMPTFLLDTLMAFNLIMGLLILLTVLYTRKAADFSVFPTLLLVMTVFGLALNVSSTRLILRSGEGFDGRMIRAFSSFVVGGGFKPGSWKIKRISSTWLTGRWFRQTVPMRDSRRRQTGRTDKN
jgi:flagellar biosynthesis component FlhA